MQVKYIAVMHPSSELYGADRILVEALKAIAPEVKKVVYLRENGPLVRFIEDNVENVKVVLVDFLPIIAKNEFGVKGVFKFVKNLFRFRAFIRKEQTKYDFKGFYLNTLATSFMLLSLTKFKVKKVMHVHEIIESPKVVNWFLAKIVNRWSDLVLCVSNVVKDNLVKNLKNDRKIIVLYNGIKKLNVNNEINVNQSLNFYLFGRIMPKKGQWLLIDALSKIPKEVLAKHQFHIVGGVLAGKDNLLDELEKKITQNGLDPWVKMHPFSNDINPLMENASVCLVPSVMKDPFPTTVLEAMSAGRVVIASNSGGAVEAIEDGTSGLLFQTSDSEALKCQIEFALRNPSSLKKLGDNSRIRFQQHFSTNVFKENWVSINNLFETKLV